MTLTRAISIPKIGGDANRDTTAGGKGVANQLAAIAISPRSARAFVPGTKPNSERGELIHPSQDLDQDNTVRNLLVEIDPAGASVAERFRPARSTSTTATRPARWPSRRSAITCWSRFRA
ncbi:MAG: hypothetical protein IPK27_12525 [Rhodanobacteraceae bacterium]|nr:hypothetical protein [Rhodanobacteraceae bacterium]